MMDKQKLIIITGPTASGKTDAAIGTALAIGGEVVSCDSMQLYRFMDIGSAKPTPEELRLVPHHLIGVVDPREPFSAAEYQKLADEAIRDIASRGRIPVLAGGTGLYVNSIVYDMDFSAPPMEEGFRSALYELAEKEGPEVLHERLKEQDPDAAARIHPNNVKKVVRALENLHQGARRADFSADLRRNERYDPVLIGIRWDRAVLYSRIDRRVDILVSMGLFEEVRRLMDMGLTEGDISMKGIGYKEIIGYYNGEYDREEAIRLVKRNTRHFAKRQLNWFRRYEDMKWFDAEPEMSKADITEMILKWLREEKKI